jgi:hypothetical protein
MQLRCDCFGMVTNVSTTSRRTAQYAQDINLEKERNSGIRSDNSLETKSAISETIVLIFFLKTKSQRCFRSSLLYVVTQLLFIVVYGRFGRAYRSNFSGSSNPRLLRMRPVDVSKRRKQ